MVNEIRTISTDPGLLTPEQLLANNDTKGRRKSLEHLLKDNLVDLDESSNVKSYLKASREAVQWLLDSARLSISYDDFMTVVTLYVLFGDWIRTLSFPSSTDPTFHVLTSISFFLFLLEMIMQCWAKSDFSKGIFRVKGYMFNFFFWLDLLCLMSMIPDIGWMSTFFGLDEMPGSVGAKAGKAGKIGAKTGRVVRMARLIRLVKLYKISSQRKRERKIIQDLWKLVELGHIDKEEVDEHIKRLTSSHKQSKVGAELSDIITRRVIVAVLLMLLVVPLLSYSSTTQNEIEVTNFLQSINVQNGLGDINDCSTLIGATDEYVDFMDNIVPSTKVDHQYLIGLSIHPSRCEADQLLSFMNDDLRQHLRKEEMREVSSGIVSIRGQEYYVDATFNLKYFMQQEALAGIYLTLFIVFMLVTLSSQFTGDAQKLVLAPIETMMAMIHMVADDPLEDHDFNSIPAGIDGATGGKSGLYETRVVQVAIQKITTLLRVGFGVAGAEIISTNMSLETEGNSAVLDPMVPGKRMYAIFGFCDIHAFDLCTEKLEDEIMTFVNSVARIVHDEVTRWGGLCNRNLGNAFLMVWRIGDETALEDISGRKRRKSQRSSTISLNGSKGNNTNVRGLSVDLRRIPGLDYMADKALIGFLKVLIEINRDRQVLCYRNDKRLASKDGTNFNIRMGFGLHAGYAIEGAVGSLQKVDATYLSPHVNMASRMGAATKQFHVPILMTGRFFELMSTEAQEQCRKIDRVTVKGSFVPMSVYTYDTFQNQSFPQLRTPKFSSLTLNDVLNKQADEYDVAFWKTDPDLIQLHCLATDHFKETFRQGLDNYLCGNWEKAREYLLKSDAMMMDGDYEGDGPSQILLRFMQTKDWKCPKAWKGFRPLTSK